MFSMLYPLAKYLKIKSVRIYDGVFMLHSKITVIILLAACVLVSATQYFGNAIDCISDMKNPTFVNNFCWTLGTYILNETNGKIGYDKIAFGIGPQKPGVGRIYLRYYQWVVLILLIQAVIFSIPAYLWRIWEGGRLQQVCQQLGSPVVSDKWDEKRKDLLIKYFTSDYQEVHTCYALKYFLCELLNFLFCVANMFAMNVFFSGFWVNYAPALGAVPLYDWDTWDSLSSRVFPKMSKCDYYQFGSSGSAQKMDVLCLLPLNILNEKLFAFFWCWFLFLTSISGINIVYRVILLANKNLRLLLLRAQVRVISRDHIQKIMRDASLGDWFVLYRVGNNMNPMVFRELMSDLLLVKEPQKSTHII